MNVGCDISTASVGRVGCTSLVGDIAAGSVAVRLCSRYPVCDRDGSTEPLRETIYQRHDDGICASTLARSADIGQATVGRIYAQFTERKAKERLSLDCPHVLGIDEHSLHCKQRFATTFCDLKNHRVFDLAPGKSDAELRPFLARLRGRDKVRVVCIDLSSSCRALIERWFPRALIVADRFRVVRVALRHLLGLARQVCPQLAWKLSWLTLLRTRGDRLTAEQRQCLAALFQQQPALQPIYELKERLCALLCIKKQTAAACRQLIPQLLAFIRTLRDSGFDLARTLAHTLDDWSEEIARMWRFTRNNGITEGFYRKMKLIQRRACGFKTSQTTACASSPSAVNPHYKNSSSPYFGVDPSPRGPRPLSVDSRVDFSSKKVLSVAD